MALETIVSDVYLDVYDHDITPTTIKTIALDSQTRIVRAYLQKRGEIYQPDLNSEVELIAIRPDKVGAISTGEVVQLVPASGDDAAIYGVQAEITQAMIAIAGKVRFQFRLTVDTEILRTEIFVANNGEALDGETSEWADEYQGYNLDELAEKVEFAVRALDDQTQGDSTQAMLSTHLYIDKRISIRDNAIHIDYPGDEPFEGEEWIEPYFAETIGAATNEWLDDHPEATTTVVDGSLTEAKFSDALKAKAIKDYVTPQMFGAVGDGETDDTEALQQAIDTGKDITLDDVYFVTDTLTLQSTTRLSFTRNGKIVYGGENACLYAIDGRQIVIENARIESSNRTGVGILLEKARNCIVKDPRIINFDTGIKIDGLDTWSASNVIYNPFIYKFNTGLYLTANSGKQTNDTKVFGGYIIDEAGRNSVCVKVDKACDTNVFVGVATEDADIGFLNQSYAPHPMSLIACRSENMTSYYFKNEASCQDLFTIGCNFDSSSDKVSVSARYNQNIDGKNITDSYFKGTLKYYDSGNTLRTWVTSDANGLLIGPGGGNQKVRLKGTNSSQVSTTYLEAGGANGLVFPDRGFTVKSSTSGSNKYFKITVDDTGTLSATEVTLS